MYVGYVDKHLNRIEQALHEKKQVAVVCSVGHRAGLAASLLRRRGFEQVSNVLMTPAVGAGGTIDGEETWTYFGKKVQEAKDLFALPANEGLGFAIDGVRVRNRLLRAPEGFYPIEENEIAVWVGPDMVLPVWISQC